MNAQVNTMSINETQLTAHAQLAEIPDKKESTSGDSSANIRTGKRMNEILYI